ncbi:MAG TPA: PEP-CTERM/exosortase system-associated acyltransferase [Pyrinomonadaceae bacterium]
MSVFGLLNLGEGFKKYFEVVPALTPNLKDHVYRIRHRVYCEELKFEPVQPNGREVDEYDAHSLHCLLRNIHNGEFVGCVRLIKARPGDRDYPFPFEKSCKDSLDRIIIDPRRLPREAIGEVSRLAVVREYRKRKGEAAHAIGTTDPFGDCKRPRFPYIPVGLYLGIIELSIRHGINTIFVLTEPRLAAHFSRLGVHVKQIGGPIEHRGLRIPSVMDCRSIIEGLSFVTRPLYRVISSEIAQHLAPRTSELAAVA